jgi:hypothetical protein
MGTQPQNPPLQLARSQHLPSTEAQTMSEEDFAPFAEESLRLADLMVAATMETWPAWDEVDIELVDDE